MKVRIEDGVVDRQSDIEKKKEWVEILKLDREKDTKMREENRDKAGVAGLIGRCRKMSEDEVGRNGDQERKR